MTPDPSDLSRIFGWTPRCLWDGNPLEQTYASNATCPQHGELVHMQYSYRGPERIEDQLGIGCTAYLTAQLELMHFLDRQQCNRGASCAVFSHPYTYWYTCGVYPWEGKLRCAACIARGFRSPLYPHDWPPHIAEGVCQDCHAATPVITLGRDTQWCHPCLLKHYRATWQEPKEDDA